MTIQVLHLEDNPDDALLVKKLLAQIRDPVMKLEQVDRLGAALKRLAEGGIDLVLLDLKLPDSAGLDTFRSVRAQAPHTPIILLVGDSGETQVAHEALQQGAQDYLLKHDLTTALLGRSVRNAIERKRIEEALKNSETRYRRLFETAHDGIFLLDATTGQITDVNPFLVTLLGYSQQEFLGKKLWEVGPFKNVEACKVAFKELRTKNYIRYENLPLQTKDGRSVEVEFVSNVYLVNGHPVIQCNVRDITVRKLGEEALRNVNKRLQELVVLKDEFVSTVSHELRTPLAITREGISLMLDEAVGPTTDKQKKVLITAQSNIDRLARIINDLLDMSKLEAGKVELKRTRVDLAALVNEVAVTFRLRAKTKGVDLLVDAPQQDTAVYADADKLTQVLTNLVGNALKFTEHGHITILVKTCPDDVTCEVNDTGKGIAKEDLSKVFGKFQQFGRATGDGEKGTGLGLAIAKGLIELHDGTIQVSSELGHGTTFRFTLPTYSIETLLEQPVRDGIRESVENSSRMSLLILALFDSDQLRPPFSPEQLETVMDRLDALIKGELRRKDDTTIRTPEGVAVLLPDCDRTGTLRVKARLVQAIQDWIVHESLAERVTLHVGCATYPDDAKGVKGLIAWARQETRTTGGVGKPQSVERATRARLLPADPLPDGNPHATRPQTRSLS